MQQSIFSAEELPANPSALPASGLDWPIPAGTLPSRILPLLQGIGPAGWFGRTSPAFFQAYPTSHLIHVRRRSTWTPVTDPQTGKRSWSMTSTTQTKAMPSGVSWPDYQNSGMGGPTEFSTLSTPEFHSAGVACSLSDVLETGEVPQQYFLSVTVCRGILRRAEKRGKALPPELLVALQSVVAMDSHRPSLATKSRTR